MSELHYSVDFNKLNDDDDDDDILCNNNSLVERVYSFNLLGITIDDILKWSSHVDSICAKVSSRLHFLKILKRSSLSTDDLFFYKSTVLGLLCSISFFSILFISFAIHLRDFFSRRAAC